MCTGKSFYERSSAKGSEAWHAKHFSTNHYGVSFLKLFRWVRLGLCALGCPKMVHSQETRGIKIPDYVTF